ncbi:hypothetical protein ACLBOM_04995 [Escherichia coli]
MKKGMFSMRPELPAAAERYRLMHCSANVG